MSLDIFINAEISEIYITTINARIISFDDFSAKNCVSSLKRKRYFSIKISYKRKRRTTTSGKYMRKNRSHYKIFLLLIWFKRRVWEVSIVFSFITQFKYFDNFDLMVAIVHLSLFFYTVVTVTDKREIWVSTIRKFLNETRNSFSWWLKISYFFSRSIARFNWKTWERTNLTINQC